MNSSYTLIKVIYITLMGYMKGSNEVFSHKLVA
jgi:hypothetical protein